MRCFKMLLVLVPLLSAAISYAQMRTGAITGIVLDEHGHPAKNATVLIADDHRMSKGGVLTDSLGQYRIERLAEGCYNINITHMGSSFKDSAYILPNIPTAIATVKMPTPLALHISFSGSSYHLPNDYYSKPHKFYPSYNSLLKDSGIAGNVFDNDSLTPAIGAVVIVKDSNGVQLGETTTDTEGYYEIKPLLAGTYTIVMRYLSAELDIVAVKVHIAPTLKVDGKINRRIIERPIVRTICGGPMPNLKAPGSTYTHTSTQINHM